ncbi:MAG: response regulator [Methylococcales bacterium]|nr:response regulator [Methylococcales bacterium]
MEEEPTRLLLIEDDLRLAELISDYMTLQGFHVTMQHRGDTAIETFNPNRIDIVILDLMLPGLNGLQVCQQIRKLFDGPILILTAKNSDIDHVMGLELGADDFVTKPIEPPVLLARLRALLRRNQLGADATPQVNELHFGQLTLRRRAQQVSLKKKNIVLTSQEFTLLWIMAENAGQVLDRDTLFESLRGIGYDGVDRAVDVRISQLRKKLQDDARNPMRLRTIWGKGYLFVPDAWG